MQARPLLPGRGNDGKPGALLWAWTCQPCPWPAGMRPGAAGLAGRCLRGGCPGPQL